jgi:hypothetical protein
MKYLQAALLVLALAPSICQAVAGRRFTIGNLSDPKFAEENEFEINELFSDLYRDKVDVTTASVLSIPRHIIRDLMDPQQEETNRFAIMQVVDDLWIEKADVDGLPGYRRFTLDNLLDQSKAAENSSKLNEMIDDLWRSKIDR